MKKTPGPRAPSDSRSPSRKMTALSYSWDKACQNIVHSIRNTTWTTFTTNKRERGKVTKMKNTEKMTIRWAIKPWPSSQAKHKYQYTFHLYAQSVCWLIQILEENNLFGYYTYNTIMSIIWCPFSPIFSLVLLSSDISLAIPFYNCSEFIIMLILHQVSTLTLHQVSALT